MSSQQNYDPATLLYKYNLISALTRIPKPPKDILQDNDKLYQWAKKAKIIASNNDPLVVIEHPPLGTENYVLHNELTIAKGYIDQPIGRFWVQYYSARQYKKGIDWSMILHQLPEKFNKEGVGLWLRPDSFRPIAEDKIVNMKNVEMEVVVYYNPPLISKRGLQRLSKKRFMELYDKGKSYWQEPHQRRNAWLLIEREYYRRFDKWSVHYLKYLETDTLKRWIKRFEKTSFYHPHKETYLKEMKEFEKKLKKNEKQYLKYQYLDE